ncbi:unnamed protein product [Rotaria socialis]|uniref:Uncharacterized protein n=1 Tax=Rotaria socialis TaxID=392032 RepID=A0A817MC00_9BILA|nr:unnamed protein product [Rotaria socialis]CAF3412520.1 unnamed protein product [Rotaria socialis]CAF3429520.1 unnamed protein product [Rotaria socialis]CAF3463662.1 unnamed protein product [Rotaria socialis]CAF3593389.1 unnamed protein product [Rotaria socialis]
MATILVLFLLIFISKTIFADLYPIVLFNDDTNILQKNTCYMANVENTNNHWCELVTPGFILPTNRICVSRNKSLPNLDDRTIVSDWIDEIITTTNCSYFLSSSMTTSQKRILTIIELILLVILFLPFLIELCLTMIQYFIY